MNELQTFLLVKLLMDGKLKRLNVEIMDGGLEETTLIASPTRNILRQYIDGTKVIEEYYQFNIRLNLQTIDDVMNGGSVVSQVVDFIESIPLGSIDDYVENGYLEEIEVTTTNYVEELESSEAIYSFTIRVEYRK